MCGLFQFSLGHSPQSYRIMYIWTCVWRGYLSIFSSSPSYLCSFQLRELFCIVSVNVHEERAVAHFVVTGRIIGRIPCNTLVTRYWQYVLLTCQNNFESKYNEFIQKEEYFTGKLIKLFKLIVLMLHKKCSSWCFYQLRVLCDRWSDGETFFAIRRHSSLSPCIQANCFSYQTISTNPIKMFSNLSQTFGHSDF